MTTVVMNDTAYNKLKTFLDGVRADPTGDRLSANELGLKLQRPEGVRGFVGGVIAKAHGVALTEENRNALNKYFNDATEGKGPETVDQIIARARTELRKPGKLAEFAEDPNKLLASLREGAPRPQQPAPVAAPKPAAQTATPAAAPRQTTPDRPAAVTTPAPSAATIPTPQGQGADRIALQNSVVESLDKLNKNKDVQELSAKIKTNPQLASAVSRMTGIELSGGGDESSLLQKIREMPDEKLKELDLKLKGYVQNPQQLAMYNAMPTQAITGMASVQDSLRGIMDKFKADMASGGLMQAFQNLDMRGIWSAITAAFTGVMRGGTAFAATPPAAPRPAPALKPGSAPSADPFPAPPGANPERRPVESTRGDYATDQMIKVAPPGEVQYRDYATDQMIRGVPAREAMSAEEGRVEAPAIAP